jgi:3-methyladenine DNA glycosylase AlkD
MAAILRRWAESDDIWKRRSAILAQLTFKNDTDRRLLYDCIRPSLGAGEFFLRKGIGWALREYAKTDAAEVLRYVRQHESQLSALTKREALKHVANQASKSR